MGFCSDIRLLNLIFTLKQMYLIEVFLVKKRLKDEKLEREYPEVWSDFSLEVVDKTLVNMFEVLSN